MAKLLRFLVMHSAVVVHEKWFLEIVFCQK